MNRPLMTGPDGLVVSATSREMAHLTHCLEREVTASQSRPVKQTSQTPCSCGGSNENCARCYGRGFIEHGAIGRTPIRKHTVAKLHSSVPPVLKSTTPVQSRIATGVSMKNCPLCNSQVREDRLQRHMTSRCPLRPQCHKLGEKVAGERYGIAEVFQRLHTSSKPERPSKLGRRGRKTKHQQVEKAQYSVRNASAESAMHKGKVEVERPSWWDNLDATKNCGYPAREEGRYGSYPSHDGFDDESKP
jgi:hypothetical protein